MVEHPGKDRVPFKAPQWLHEAAKKTPPPPSKAFMDRLRVAQNRPDEFARKLRQNTNQAGRDPEALIKLMAGMRQNVQVERPAQRSNDIQMSVEAEDGRSDISESHVGDETYNAEVDAPSPAALLSQANSELRGSSVEVQERATTQNVARPALPSAIVQRRVGAKGQVAKLAHPQRREERDMNRNTGRRTTPKSGATSSANGTASPMIVDSPQNPAETTVTDTVNDALDATSRMLEEHNVAFTRPAAQSYPFPIRTAMPAWYNSISQQKKSQLEKKRPPEFTAIDALKDCIRRCGKGPPSKLSREYNALRDHVYKAEIRLHMDKNKVKRTGIITPQNGLPRIFAENAEHANFPWDLKADAWHLYEKWMNEDFDNDILRGIVTVKGKDRNGDRLDPAYREKHPKDPKNFGNNGAILGQWWPSQLCAVRDGVHGAAQGGIYGDKDGGTYSIVLSSGGYHDRDDGDVIEYSGTEGSDFVMKAATQSMVTSCKLGNHIRVLRSSQLPKANKHRPSCGLRYDGLYQIKSYKEIDKQKQTYRFHLERISGQEPIRSQGVTKRPTVFEEEAYQKCKGRL